MKYEPNYNKISKLDNLTAHILIQKLYKKKVKEKIKEFKKNLNIEDYIIHKY